MGRDEVKDGGGGNANGEPWYAVKCVFFADDSEQFGPHYEERVVLWKAESAEQALRLGEDEAARYADENGFLYTGFSESYHLFGPEVGHGSEVFSSLRASDLPPGEYLEAHYDEGAGGQWIKP